MKRILLILILFLIVTPVLADVPYWECYGGTTISWILSSEDFHGGVNAAKMSDPASSTYKIMYQSVAIDPSKSYSAEAWVKNIDYTNAEYVKIRLGFYKDDSWLGNSFKYYTDQNTTTRNSWVSLSILNQPANGTNYYAKIGLYVHYPAAGSYTAFWDDVKLYATDAPGVNLLKNGDFETTTGPVGGAAAVDTTASLSNTKITLDRKIFSPYGNEKVKISFNLPFKNSDLLIRAYDSKGNLVKDIYNGDELKATFPAYSGEVYWDGKNDLGEKVRIGPYFIILEATNLYTGEVTKMKALIIIGRELK